MWIKNFQMFRKSEFLNKLSLEKAEEWEINLPTTLDHKARKFQESLYFCFIDYAKDFV